MISKLNENKQENYLIDKKKFINNKQKLLRIIIWSVVLVSKRLESLSNSRSDTEFND